MNVTLTPNSVTQLSSPGAAAAGFEPVVQVIDIRQVANTGMGGTPARFRIILSDGNQYLQGMLASQLNHVVHDNLVTINCFIRVEEYLTNLVQGRTVVILLRLQVVGNPGHKIGQPVEYDEQQSARQNTQAPSQPMYGNAAPGTGGSAVGGGMRPNPVQSGNSSYGNYASTGGYNNRYGGQQQQQASAPIVRSNAASTQHFIPIASLNMYQNRWTIKARVTTKSDIRTWSNAKGDGSLFSVELLDSSQTDIRATFFKEAVDRFYHMLEPNRVYTFSGGRLKVANMQYNSCKSGFEISFDQNAEIHLVGDDDAIQQGSFDFIKINSLESVDPQQYVDLLGIVKSVGPVASVTSKKTGNELLKAELTVADDSCAEVCVTIWGDRAKSAEQEFANEPLVAFKRLRVSDFCGRSVSVSGGNVVINPRLPQAGAVIQWWNAQGRTGMVNLRNLSMSVMGGSGMGRGDSLADRKVLASIKEENMGFNEKPDWVTFKATFNFIKKDKEGGPWYPACANPNEPCKNRFKVTETTDMMWHCDKCNQTNQKCVRRFIFSATLIDDSTTSWVSLFDEQAKQLLGGGEVTADKLHEQFFAQEGDIDGFDAIFSKACFTDWIVKCKVKQEMVGDESRVKTSVYSLSPLDYAKEGRELLAAISAMG